MNTATIGTDFQEQLRFQAHLLDVIGQAVVATDLNGIVTYVNRFAERLYGWERAEAIGTPLIDLIPADASPEQLAGFRAARRRGESWSGEFNVRDRSGRTFPIMVTSTPFRDASNNLVGVITLSSDISERRGAEEQRRQSEERFRLVTLATDDAIWDWDLVRNHVWWSDNVYSLFRYDRDQIPAVLQWWDSHLHPQDQPRVFERLNGALEQRHQFWSDEYRFLRGDGTYAYVMDRGYLLYDSEGTPVRMIGAMVDITERRRTEEELREREEQYRRIVETAQEGIWVTDPMGVTTFVNARMAEMMGCQIDEMIGMKFEQFMDEEGKELARGNKDRRISGIAEHYDFKLIHRNGSPVWTIISANPIFDRNGELAGSLAMITDITGRKLAEDALQEAHDQLELRVAERTGKIVEMMSRLEESNRLQKRFVADASHDIRTPLTVVRAEVDLLLRRNGLDGPTTDALQRVASEAARLDRLASDLLLLAMLDGPRQTDSLRMECLDEMLLDSVSNLTSLARQKGLAWSIRCDESIGLLCDSHAMQRALTNVLENAIKYTRQGSIIDIQIVRENERVRLAVTDQGEGIPPEDLPRIFDRFYRSDRNRSTRGSGLGLSIIKSVVESHNGEVTVESTVGAGTTVTMILPATGAPASRENICV